MTYCVITAPMWDQRAWFSLEVPLAPIDSVSLYIYNAWPDALAPYQIWTGSAFGETGVRCDLADNDEPSHGGLPARAFCHGATARYISMPRSHSNFARLGLGPHS